MSDPAGDTSRADTSDKDPTVLIPAGSPSPDPVGDEAPDATLRTPPPSATSAAPIPAADPVQHAGPMTPPAGTPGFAGATDPDVTQSVPATPAGTGFTTGEIPDPDEGPISSEPVVVGPDTEATAARDPQRWTAGDVLGMIVWPLLLWAAGRATTLAVAALATPVNGATWRDVVGRIANSAGYIAAATNGYQRPLPPGPKGVGPSAAQFFPGFPTLVGLVAHYAKVSTFMAGLIVSLVGGLLATMVVWGMARAFLGERGAGNRAAALFSFAPGALLLGVIDPIGLFVVVAGIALWCMGRGKLVAAGILVALTWMLHPAAALLTAILLVAAIAAAVRGKGSGLAGGTLAVLGGAAAALTFWLLTGTPLAWVTTQIDAAEGGFWLHATTEKLLRAVAHPADTSTYGALIGVVVGVAGLLALISRRLSPTFGLYTLAVGALAYFLLPLGLGPTALLLAFPIAIGLARIKSVPFALVMALSVAASVLVTYLTVRGGASLL